MAGSQRIDVRKDGCVGPAVTSPKTQSTPYTSQLERNPRRRGDSRQSGHHRGSPTPPGPWKCAETRDPQLDQVDQPRCERELLELPPRGRNSSVVPQIMARKKPIKNEGARRNGRAMQED